MPNRLIKESICTSDNLDRLSWFEEVLFYRLIVNCDDFGRMDARLPILRSRLFPLKQIPDAHIPKALLALRSADLIDLYEVDGRSYLQIRKWESHQQVRAKRSKYPAPDSNLQASDINCNQVLANVPVIQSESESISESESNARVKRTRFVPPTPEEATAFFTENGGTATQAQRFCDYYASKGWLVGKSPMKDWHAAARGWISRDKSSGYTEAYVRPAEPPRTNNPFLQMLEEEGYAT